MAVTEDCPENEEDLGVYNNASKKARDGDAGPL